MARLLRLFIILGTIALLAAWLADNPGQLQLDWRGYRIESSFIVLLGGALALYALLRGPLWLYGWWRGARGQLSRQSSGIDALTRGMTAIAAGNAPEARRHAGRAGKLLDGKPLALLMQAQAAELGGDEAAARGHFQAMLAAPETEFLGLRGLLSQALRQGDTEYAGRLAERAMRLQPKSPWLIQKKFEIECAAGFWPQARETLGRAAQTKLISKPERARRQALLAFAEATGALEKGGEAAALASAQAALKGAPDLVPAAILAARLLARAGKPDKAARVLEKSWAAGPHPDLAETYGALAANESPAQRVVRMRKLIAANPDHLESRLLGAETALAAGETARARELLKPLTLTGAGGGADRRIFMLMGQIARAQGLGEADAQRWLARAAHAAPNPAWHCRACHNQTPDWRLSCPACGEFDAIRWSAGIRSTTAETAPAPGLLAPGAPL